MTDTAHLKQLQSEHARYRLALEEIAKCDCHAAETAQQALGGAQRAVADNVADAFERLSE